MYKLLIVVCMWFSVAYVFGSSYVVVLGTSDWF